MTVTIHVECGDLDWIVTARSYKDAFRKAVKEAKPERLAPLYRFRYCRENSDRPIYTSPFFYADAMRHLPKSLTGSRK